MIRRLLIRLLTPAALCTALAVLAARMIFGNASAQAELLVIAGAVAGGILGGIWMIKYIERLGETQRTREERG